MHIPKSWLAMEAEHTSSVAGQRKIVKEHIAEHGFSYYPALRKMEHMLDKKKR